MCCGSVGFPPDGDAMGWGNMRVWGARRCNPQTIYKKRTQGRKVQKTQKYLGGPCRSEGFPPGVRIRQILPEIEAEPDSFTLSSFSGRNLISRRHRGIGTINDMCICSVLLSGGGGRGKKKKGIWLQHRQLLQFLFLFHSQSMGDPGSPPTEAITEGKLSGYLMICRGSLRMPPSRLLREQGKTAHGAQSYRRAAGGSVSAAPGQVKKK